MKTIDLVIIGGGSAGMAAAIQAKKEGINDILILEKEGHMGGILEQCIHNGFGLTEFKEELTGPEYYQRFLNQVDELKIPYKTNSMVVGISEDKVVTYSNLEEGLQEVKAKAIVHSTGCFERSASMINLPGDRCAGVMTAGTAQKYLNINGYMCGKRVVILGSGDIGLIMARRLTLEGARVICVSEIMPYSNGLNRNIAQCLNDFNIPLYLSRSVSKVEGKKRLERVTLTAVDDKMQFIPGTEMVIDCDTLILSVGLQPYVHALEKLNCPMSSSKGPLVNEHMQTKIKGIFACGNGLHVHDVVDFVTDEGRLAGHGAAMYIKGELPKGEEIPTKAGEGVGYVLPHFIMGENKESITLKLRVRKPIQDVYVVVESNGETILKQFKPALIPSEMLMLNITSEKVGLIKGELTVRLEKKA